MRITESIKFANITSQLGQLRERYAKATQESSSGKRVNAPSDDPIAAAEDARVQASLSQTTAFRDTITLVQGDVQMAESSLDSAGQLMQRAIEIAMSGANGSNGANQFQALADEANQLADGMIAISNAKGAQGYLFAGTKTDTSPFDALGVYLGNDQEKQVSIDDGAPIAVTVSGTRAFADPTGRNVIQDLKDLAAALARQDSSAVHSLLSGLESGHGQIVQERAKAGLILDRLSLTDSFLSQASINLKARSSSLTDADAVEALTTLSQLQTTIQQAVSVDQKLLQTTAMTLNS